MMGDRAKLYGFEESVKIGRLLNITKVTFKTDCASLASRIKKHCNCNKVEDFTINYAISNEDHLVFGIITLR
ncbi:hypothetical protein Gohar_015700 [Gossypium harknessii]|uniref:RNase H type-1 domain-containing protein n=1 Tax=Gossypium harknessii TaxID=34285 RepID=A0A7J9G129_9ROSI|nr:hypothetical protein [Gossypium harknessii]